MAQPRFTIPITLKPEENEQLEKLEEKGYSRREIFLAGIESLNKD